MPALAQALDSFFAEQKLPRRGVRLGLATNRIGVRAFDVDGIADERQLANAIRFRAHEAVSIPIDEAVLDYHVIEETLDDDGCRLAGASSWPPPIANRSTATSRRPGREDRALRDRSRGLRPASRGRHCTAALRGRDRTRDRVAVSLGHDRTTLAISDGSVCEFTRVLEWGGGKLEHAIALDLGVTPDEAFELKLAASLEPDADAERQDPRAVEGARGHPRRAPEALPGARCLAPVLPEPARLAGHRRDPGLGRDEPDSRLARGARAPIRRCGPARRTRSARFARQTRCRRGMTLRR